MSRRKRVYVINDGVETDHRPFRYDHVLNTVASVAMRACAARRIISPVDRPWRVHSTAFLRTRVFFLVERADWSWGAFGMDRRPVA
jgi:hypothetical protein